MKKLHTFFALVIGFNLLLSCNKETSKPEEKEVEIAVTQLPSIIKDNINRTYVGCTMNEADEITHEGGKITYDVELTHNGKTVEVMYDTEGNFLGEENEEGGEEDDSKESEKED